MHTYDEYLAGFTVVKRVGQANLYTTRGVSKYDHNMLTYVVGDKIIYDTYKLNGILPELQSDCECPYCGSGTVGSWFDGDGGWSWMNYRCGIKIANADIYLLGVLTCRPIMCKTIAAGADDLI